MLGLSTSNKYTLAYFMAFHVFSIGHMSVSEPVQSPKLKQRCQLTSAHRRRLRKRRWSSAAPTTDPESAPAPESTPVSPPAKEHSIEMALFLELSQKSASALEVSKRVHSGMLSRVRSSVCSSP